MDEPLAATLDSIRKIRDGMDRREQMQVAKGLIYTTGGKTDQASAEIYERYTKKLEQLERERAESEHG